VIGLPVGGHVRQAELNAKLESRRSDSSVRLPSTRSRCNGVPL